MKKLLHRSTAIAALVVAVGLAGSTGLRAQSAPGRLPPQQKDYDKNQQTDYDNAERLHLLFSEVPYDYCRTPAVVQAIATIDAEIKLVTNALVNDSFHGYINAGKEEEYRSLERILDRLRLNRQRLTGLPSCDTAFRTVFANGIFLGIYVVKSSGRVFITERFIPTDRISNDFSDWHDPLGVGFNVAYAFTPWNNSLVVSPFVSFDYLNNSVNHTFAGGSFLGSTANASGTAGVKIGPSLTRDFWLYGIAGVSVLNETLNVNFLPVTSSASRTVAGGTLGAGFAFKPCFLQNLGRPVSLFAEYHHSWWQDAQFNSPAASPLFNYNFRRADDVVKLGFNVHFDEPPRAPAPSNMPVKAPLSR
jgi:hypothetical protein